MPNVGSTYNHQKLEPIQMSFNGWMEKQNVSIPQKSTEQQNKWTIDTHSNLDESERCYAVWEKWKIAWSLITCVRHRLKDKTVGIENKSGVARIEAGVITKG